MKMEVFELTKHLEERIDSTIKGISIYEWNENFITDRLLSDFRKSLSSIQLEGKDYRKNINWEIYKLSGTCETKFGDIALVVNLSFKDGTSLNGAAFLEAKKRDWRKTTFKAMNIPQLKRIIKHAPRANYLLYDYEDITNFLHGTSFYEERSYYRSPLLSTPKTRAVCVPLNLAGATKFKDTLLYRHGTPLSIMLANRYFQGLDLEFDDRAKQIATGYLKKFGLPKYVMKIDIAEGEIEPSNNKQINLDEYRQIE